MTSHLDARWFQHQSWTSTGFTGKYHVNRLVWYEQHDSIEAAIRHKKQLKKWNRAWKIELIEKNNPNWDDLALRWYEAE